MPSASSGVFVAGSDSLVAFTIDFETSMQAFWIDVTCSFEYARHCGSSEGDPTTKTPDQYPENGDRCHTTAINPNPNPLVEQLGTSVFASIPQGEGGRGGEGGEDTMRDFLSRSST